MHLNVAAFPPRLKPIVKFPTKITSLASKDPTSKYAGKERF